MGCMDRADVVPHTPFIPSRAPLDVLDDLHGVLRQRRSVRAFSDRPVARALIEGLVRCATTAPSGANKQPWRFVAVSDPALKREIRLGAEAEERAFYERRANAEWLRDLEPFGTDPDKGFLEVAPWLVVLFQMTKTDDEGQVYYVKESVGLAAGMFLAAAQLAGLATLTHTPSPMGFLREILGRPEHERPFLLIPVGYPLASCEVPRAASARRPLEDVLVFDRLAPESP
ncbi:MAG: hypothetical protein RL562_839 [Planctomycetota bacterium]